MGEIMEKSNQRKVPVYLQIAFQLRQKILKNELKPQEKMPSIRKLAKELGVNPNTVKKSYQILEEQNLIKSDGTKGTFVTKELEMLLEQRIKDSFDTINYEAKELKKLGVSLNRVVEGIEKKWKIL